MAETKKQTCNIDVHSLARRINRFIDEITHSQSSGVSQTMAFDVRRVKSYISSLKALIAHIVAQPLLDLPETGPIWMDLPSDAAMPDLENESAYDLCMLFSIMRDELVNSQSSRLATNLVKFDHQRALDIIAKIESMLSYVEVAEPIDLPESSPREALVGKGLTGV